MEGPVVVYNRVCMQDAFTGTLRILAVCVFGLNGMSTFCGEFDTDFYSK